MSRRESLRTQGRDPPAPVAASYGKQSSWLVDKLSSGDCNAGRALPGGPGWNFPSTSNTASNNDHGDRIPTPIFVFRAGAFLPCMSLFIVELVGSTLNDDGMLIPGHVVVEVKAKYVLKLARENAPHPDSLVRCSLPYFEVFDELDAVHSASPEVLDAYMAQCFTVGWSIDCVGRVLYCDSPTVAVVCIRPQRNLHKTDEEMEQRGWNKVIIYMTRRKTRH
jgi:hypothetical protein